MKGFGAHACFLDPECREYGAPRRLYLFTPWGTWIAGEPTQVWLPHIGYTDRFAPVAWHPDRRRS